MGTSCYYCITMVLPSDVMLSSIAGYKIHIIWMNQISFYCFFRLNA